MNKYQQRRRAEDGAQAILADPLPHLRLGRDGQTANKMCAGSMSIGSLFTVSAVVPTASIMNGFDVVFRVVVAYACNFLRCPPFRCLCCFVLPPPLSVASFAHSRRGLQLAQQSQAMWKARGYDTQDVADTITETTENRSTSHLKNGEPR